MPPHALSYAQVWLKTKLASATISNNPSNPSPLLPPEILLPIFEEVQAETNRTAIFLYWSHILIDTFYPRSWTTPGQATLRNVVRVCRTWHAVGTPILYSSPILQSRQRVRQFSRTVSSSLYLAKLVKSMYVVTELTRYSYWSAPKQISFFASRAVKKLMKACRLDYERGMRKHSPAATDALLIALRCCSSLQSLVSTQDYQANYLNRHSPIEPQRLCTFQGIGTHLRTLILYGPMVRHTATRMPYGLPPDLHLPYLEVLSLREFIVFRNYPFPCFPRLHTLQLSQCQEFPRERRAIPLSIDQFPSLKSIDLYCNFFILDLDVGICNQIQRFYVQVMLSMSTFAGATPNLQHTMVPIWTTDLSMFHLDPNISRFLCGPTTLVLDLKFTPDFMEQFQRQAVDVMVRISSQKGYSLKRLILIPSVPFLDWEKEESDSDSDEYSELRAACELAGTELYIPPRIELSWITFTKIASEYSF